MNKLNVLTSLALVGASLFLGGASPASGADQDGHRFSINVAIDGTTLALNTVDPNEPPGSQSRGDTFIVNGTIYLGGTLPSVPSQNDPNAPGGIGKIKCRGVLLTSSTDFTSLAYTFVTELYIRLRLPVEVQNSPVG